MSNAPRSRPKPAAGTARSLPRAGILIGVGLALVVLIGILIALGGSDDGDDGGSASDAPAFGPVSVEGEALVRFERTAGDPAVGTAAPVVDLRNPDGEPASIGGGGQPSLVVFLAHWCPHCRAEVPVLVDLGADDAFAGVRLVAVATGTNPDAPNFPPVPWLEREGWPGEVLLDDDEASAAEAFGLNGYPYMVALDGEGRVVGRTSGEQPAEVVEAMVDAARGAAGG